MLAYLIVSALCGCEVLVMAPLDLVNERTFQFQYKGKLEWWCQRLKEGNVNGIMLDVWWGLTERSPRVYNFEAYQEAFEIIRNNGLKIVPVFSFHRCGGSVGDYVNIPLPSFVWGTQNPKYRDANGHEDDAYISLGYDDVKVGSDRTPLEMYRDWMKVFKSTFQSYLDDGTILELEIGAGPCGELRYPGYQTTEGAGWSYPGCGMFQCFDPQMLQMFKDDARNSGHSEWDSPPSDAGHYNVRPGGSSFWQSGYASEYGKFFQKWYQDKLIEHGDKLLKIAREIFPSNRLSCKISGLHWQYTNPTHCAESTTGFYNSNGNNGYLDICQMFKRHNVDVCFTCLEMDAEYGDANSNAPALVKQVLEATKACGLRFEGENALERYDWGAYNNIKNWVPQGLETFTYLRMTDTLMNNNWDTFKSFVQLMNPPKYENSNNNNINSVSRSSNNYNQERPKIQNVVKSAALNNQYYWTNKNGAVGSAKTIKSFSDWTESDKIVQGAANDDPRAFRGYHEKAVDLYSLFAAYDADNLYLMIEMPSIDGRDITSKDWQLALDENLGMGIAINTGKRTPGDGELITNGKKVTPWHSDKYYSITEGIDTLLMFHPSEWGTPGFFITDNDGKFSYDPQYCLTFKGQGVTTSCQIGSVSSNFWGRADNYALTKDDYMAKTDFQDLKKNPPGYMYQITISLKGLGIDKSYLESHGISLMAFSTFGTSMMDCLPWDPVMIDTATEAYSKDSSTSHEKEDVDIITVPLARIGHL